MGSNVAPLTLKVLEKRFRFDLAQHRFVAMSFLLIKYPLLGHHIPQQ